MLIVSFLSGYFVAYSQHYNEVDAVLNTETQTIEIQQKLKFQNHFDTPLTEIYFTDWVSSYSSPTTPLVEKFLNEFNTNLYIAKSKKRGFTTIKEITTSENERLKFHHLETQEDILKVKLKSPLGPNESITLNLNYSVKIQNDRFTDYGVNKKGNYALESWYMTPAVFDGKAWKLYSNQNLDDLYSPPMHTKIHMTLPKHYLAYTALDVIDLSLIHI